MRTPPVVFVLWLAAVFVVTGCDSGSSVPADVGANTTLAFEETSASASEDDGSVTLNIVVNDAGFKTLSVEIVRAEGTLDEDEYILPETITIPESITTGESFPVEITLVDDDVFAEGIETVTFRLQDPSGAGLGETELLTLAVEDDDIPTTNAEAKSAAVASGGGEEVVVDGIITRTVSDGFYVQDDTGGLFVAESNADVTGPLEQGDLVVIRGTTDFSNSLFQITDLDEERPVRVVSSGNDLPAAQVVTTADVAANGEDFESELVRVRFLEFASGSGTFATSSDEYDVSDLTNVTVPVFVPSGAFYAGEPRPEQAVFTGVVGQFVSAGAPDDDSGYRLLALEDGDIQESSFTVQTLVDEDFSSGSIALSSFFQFSVASNADWETANFSGSNFYAEANGFGADEASNDWLISPSFDLTSIENDVLFFNNTSNFSDEIRGLKVLISTDYDGTSNPEDFTWTDVSDQANFSSGGFNTVTSGAVDLTASSFQETEVYVAFQYESTGTGPGEVKTWQVDDILLRGAQ